ncbi:MAG: D-alanyl-D-alanine carboxypeptidase family protein, partial [Thermacetogeniaceae bacterium]
MKKGKVSRHTLYFHLLLFVSIFSSLLMAKAAPVAAKDTAIVSLPQLTAEAAILIDGTTGHVLYSLNADRKMHPASTTKILSALLGLELGNKKDVVHVSPNAAYKEGTTLYLYPGDELHLFDIIKGALINSGNDAATAIAEHLGGREDIFSSLMTYKAKTLGAYRSEFRNPHGLTDPEHLATAYDLALIARYALQNKDFRKIVSTKETTIFETKSGKPIPLNNTNRLLNNCEYPVIGVKTGT